MNVFCKVIEMVGTFVIEYFDGIQLSKYTNAELCIRCASVWKLLLFIGSQSITDICNSGSCAYLLFNANVSFNDVNTKRAWAINHQRPTTFNINRLNNLAI